MLQQRRRAAVLALDNYLMADRVREVFHELSCVRRAMDRLGFLRVAPPPDVTRQAS